MKQETQHYLDEINKGLGGINPDLIGIAIEILNLSRKTGSRVWLVGNGGSAANAEHWAADLQTTNCAALPLTSAPSLTAAANDYRYQEAFSTPLSRIADPNDVLVAFSTSGASENILRAVRLAPRWGIGIIALTGQAPNPLFDAVRGLPASNPAPVVAIAVDLPWPDVVEDVHMMIGHIITRALR